MFFDYDNRIRGFSGVNNFFGQYELKTLYSIDIGPLATTRRGGAYLDYERYFLKMLGEEINTALKYNDELYLYNDSNLRMVLELANPDVD